MTARRLLFLLGGVFGLLGVGLLAGAVYAQRSAAAFDAAAVRATAVIVDFEARRSSGSRPTTTYAPIFEFSDREGRKHRATSTISRSTPEHRIGQGVEVLYLPSAPEEARLDTWAERWVAVTILGSLGGVLSLVGLGLAAVGLRFAKQEPSADGEGAPGDWPAEPRTVQAKVVSVERGEAAVGRRPWFVVAQWRDPSTGRVHVFESEEIDFDPSDHVLGRTVEVHIDSDDPEDYSVDLSFLPESS
jgi:hypothetical protein